MSESSDSDKGRSKYQNRHVDKVNGLDLKVNGPDLKVNGRDQKVNGPDLNVRGLDLKVIDQDHKVWSVRKTVYSQQDLNIKILGQNCPSHPGSISFWADRRPWTLKWKIVRFWFLIISIGQFKDGLISVLRPFTFSDCPKIWVYRNLSKEYNGFSRSFFEIWSFYLILTRQNGPSFLLNQNRFQNWTKITYFCENFIWDNFEPFLLNHFL